MAAIDFVPASRAHVGRVARRMRAIDRLECEAKGRAPDAALRYSLAASTMAVTVFIDGSPHAMFGVCPGDTLTEGVIGRPWFLGTDELFRYPRSMLVMGRRAVDLMERAYPRLENVIAVENRRGLAMLPRWGFSVGSDLHWEGGVQFISFWKGRPHV